MAKQTYVTLTINFVSTVKLFAMPDSSSRPVVEIYTSPFCGYCGRAKALLQQKGVTFQEYDVMMDSNLRAVMTERAGGDHRVPQVFINDEHIGGSDKLMMLEMAGGLDAKLASA